MKNKFSVGDIVRVCKGKDRGLLGLVLEVEPGKKSLFLRWGTQIGGAQDYPIRFLEVVGRYDGKAYNYLECVHVTNN